MKKLIALLTLSLFFSNSQLAVADVYGKDPTNPGTVAPYYRQLVNEDFGTGVPNVICGSSDPLSETGANGQYYINSTTLKIFGPKTSGAWGSGQSLGSGGGSVATLSAVAGQNIAAGALISLVNNSGTINIMNADSTTNLPVMGFAPTAIANTVTGTVSLGNGKVSGLTGLTDGSTYFLSTAGTVSTTPPAAASGYTLQTVGTATDSTDLNLIIGQPVVRSTGTPGVGTQSFSQISGVATTGQLPTNTVFGPQTGTTGQYISGFNSSGNPIYGTPGGGTSTIITTSSPTYTASSYSTVLCDATSNVIAFTLPDATVSPGINYTIVKIDAGYNAVNIGCTGGQTISGASGLSIRTQCGLIQVESDGANWKLINQLNIQASTPAINLLANDARSLRRFIPNYGSTTPLFTSSGTDATMIVTAYSSIQDMFSSGYIGGEIFSSGTSGEIPKFATSYAFIPTLCPVTVQFTFFDLRLAPIESTNSRFWAGCFSSDPSGSDTIPNGSMGIRYSASAGDTTFKLISHAISGSPSVIDTGITPSAPNAYTFTLDASPGFFDSSTGVQAYLNGKLIGTGASNQNPNNVPLQDYFQMSVTALDAEEVGCGLGQVQAEF